MNERGQAAIFAIGITMVVLGVVAFAVDATRAFLYRRSLQNAADAASVAAASQLDITTYYESRGIRLTLDPASARSAAARSLGVRAIQARAEVSANPERVEVVLRDDLETVFLHMIGVDAIPVAAHAVAEPIRSRPTP